MENKVYIVKISFGDYTEEDMTVGIALTLEDAKIMKEKTRERYFNKYHYSEEDCSIYYYTMTVNTPFWEDEEE